MKPLISPKNKTLQLISEKNIINSSCIVSTEPVTKHYPRFDKNPSFLQVEKTFCPQRHIGPEHIAELPAKRQEPEAARGGERAVGADGGRAQESSELGPEPRVAHGLARLEQCDAQAPRRNQHAYQKKLRYVYLVALMARIFRFIAAVAGYL